MSQAGRQLDRWPNGPPVRAAFMSYAHGDDVYGDVTRFRNHLRQAVYQWLGEPFEILQDKEDIGWGQEWHAATERMIRSVTFFIPIVTPLFFKSERCRNELRWFLDYERTLGRSDLVLPVHFMDYPPLRNLTRPAADELLGTIAERHFSADWREHRTESMTSPLVRRKLDHIAKCLVDALMRIEGPGDGAASATTAHRSGGPGSSSMSATPAPPAGSLAPVAAGGAAGEPVVHPVPKTEPSVMVVAQLGARDHTSIGEAIAAASPGSRIVVGPGVYEECLVIDKPLEIIGQSAEVVVRGRGASALLFMTTMGRVSGLKLRQAADGDRCCVDITQGRLELVDCDISSASLACVAIRGGADPWLRRNRIHGGAAGGVLVHDGGEGTLEDNEIYGHALAGVEISATGNPTLRRNKIHDCEETGVFVHDRGEGIVDDNLIYANALAGIEIRTGGRPTVRRNRIYDGKENGVLVHEHGRGIIEENEIFGNALAGIEIRSGGDPAVRANRVHSNRGLDVWRNDETERQAGQLPSSRTPLLGPAIDRESGAARPGLQTP